MVLPEALSQRATGDLHASFSATGLATLRQQGCLKAMFPRSQHRGWAEVVQLNNAGGIAGGDRLSLSLHALGGASLLATTASAERIYRRAASDSAAIVRNNLVVDRGARIEWLPQETILFDNCALHRTLDITLADGAELLGIEMIVFGRIAMGERVRQADFRDVIRIHRCSRLILHDALLPPHDIASWQSHPAGAGGARAAATLFRCAPDTSAMLAPVRAILAGHPGLVAGCSAWDGMLVVRMLAAEPPLLRGVLAALLHRLRDGRMLPRVWNC